MTVTQIKIKFSQIENKCQGGNLFFTDTDTELSLSNILSNFVIYQGKMIIEKIKEEEYFENMLDYIVGILYQNKKIIFGKNEKTQDFIEIEVTYPDYSVPVNSNLIQNPEYQPLFFEIIDSELYVNNNSNFIDFLEDYYVIELKNVSYRDLTQ